MEGGGSDGPLLTDFIPITMTMSHHQPLQIRTFVRSGSAAIFGNPPVPRPTTVRAGARTTDHDDSAQNLKKRRIATVGRGTLHLTGSGLALDTDADIIGVCNQCISEFLAERGPGASNSASTTT